MRLSGVKKQTLSLFILFSLGCGASDFGIALPEQLKGDKATYEFSKKEDKKENKKDSGVDLTMGDREFTPKQNEDESLYSIPGSVKEVNLEPSEKNKIVNSGNIAPFQNEDKESVTTFTNKGIHKEIYNKSVTALSLSYLMDEYDVTGRNGAFDRTFGGPGGRRGGYVHFTYDSYLSKAWLNTFYGFGLAVGFSSGKGQFSNSTAEITNTNFQLFSVPVDLRLGFELVPSRYFKFLFAGGPSAMGLYQSRDDLPRENDDRYRRQISHGYFGQAKLQINLSALFSGLAFSTYSRSDMTNMFLNLEARTHNYENFQDDLTITGSTFGIGFTFEYL